MPEKLVPCSCGKMKKKKSKQCRECFVSNRNKKEEYDTCKCGKNKKKESKTCRNCWKKDNSFIGHIVEDPKTLRDKIIKMVSEGVTQKEIGQMFNLTKSAVSYYLKKNTICTICGKNCDKRKSICLECSSEKRRQKMLKTEQTIGEKTYDKHKYAKYSYVRYHAREVMKEAGINKCQKCGYDKHIECCHIKAVSSFPPETKISEINSLDNLIGLCPNCHWEFDNLK